MDRAISGGGTTLYLQPAAVSAVSDEFHAAPTAHCTMSDGLALSVALLRPRYISRYQSMHAQGRPSHLISAVYSIGDHAVETETRTLLVMLHQVGHLVDTCWSPKLLIGTRYCMYVSTEPRHLKRAALRPRARYLGAPIIVCNQQLLIVWI